MSACVASWHSCKLRLRFLAPSPRSLSIGSAQATSSFLPLSLVAESRPRIPAASAMSEGHLRRRIPSTRQKSRPLHPTGSSNARTPSAHRRSRPRKAAKILQRCSSEPILWTVGISDAADDQSHHHPHGLQLKQQMLLFRPQTCTDVFSSPSPLFSPSPSTYSLRRYSDDSKVVVNVTVQGSPGPVRTMVRLGATVEETIKLVVDKYTEEGRNPRLAMDASSTFELHHSHFSLESELNSLPFLLFFPSLSVLVWFLCSALLWMQKKLEADWIGIWKCPSLIKS
ncbi:hypothetical protein ACLOJK_005366 [Asimina triloba]